MFKSLRKLFKDECKITINTDCYGINYQNENFYLHLVKKPEKTSLEFAIENIQEEDLFMDGKECNTLFIYNKNKYSFGLGYSNYLFKLNGGDENIEELNIIFKNVRILLSVEPMFNIGFYKGSCNFYLRVEDYWFLIDHHSVTLNGLYWVNKKNYVNITKELVEEVKQYYLLFDTYNKIIFDSETKNICLYSQIKKCLLVLPITSPFEKTFCCQVDSLMEGTYDRLLSNSFIVNNSTGKYFFELPEWVDAKVQKIIKL